MKIKNLNKILLISLILSLIMFTSITFGDEDYERDDDYKDVKIKYYFDLNDDYEYDEEYEKYKDYEDNDDKYRTEVNSDLNVEINNKKNYDPKDLLVENYSDELNMSNNFTYENKGDIFYSENVTKEYVSKKLENLKNEIDSLKNDLNNGSFINESIKVSTTEENLNYHNFSFEKRLFNIFLSIFNLFN